VDVLRSMQPDADDEPAGQTDAPQPAEQEQSTPPQQ
jgi:hypothetical protein